MSKKSATNPERRRLYLVAGLCTLGSGLGVAKYLADRSQPPEGDPMPVDFGDLPPGKLLTTDWNGRTVWIIVRCDRICLSPLDNVRIRVVRLSCGKGLAHMASSSVPVTRRGSTWPDAYSASDPRGQIWSYPNIGWKAKPAW